MVYKGLESMHWGREKVSFQRQKNENSLVGWEVEERRERERGPGRRWEWVCSLIAQQRWVEILKSSE